MTKTDHIKLNPGDDILAAHTGLNLAAVRTNLNNKMLLINGMYYDSHAVSKRDAEAEVKHIAAMTLPKGKRYVRRHYGVAL